MVSPRLCVGAIFESTQCGQFWYTESMTFWNSLQQLVDKSIIKIDRPKDSVHPRYPDYIYPFDYGYLEGTTSGDGGGDGDGIDCWVGSLGGREVTGVVTVVDAVKGDCEIKILIGCTSDDMQTILKCHKRGSMDGLLTEK